MAEHAARLLGEDWTLTEREAPDFLVSSSKGAFALEVTEALTGEVSRRGSVTRKRESGNDRWLDAIRREYEAGSSAKLYVRYSGARTERARSEIVQHLLGENFADKPILHRTNVKLSDGQLWVTNEFHPRWLFLRDRVGWVSQDPSYLARAIAHKAALLQKYKLVSDDVRLLVFADRTLNSGKLSLDALPEIDLQGFSVVYFLSYPVEALRFDTGGCSCVSLSDDENG